MRSVLMSRYVYMLLAGVLLAAACKKSTGEGTTQVLVSNATITTNDLTVLWSNVSLTPTALAMGKTSGTTAAPYQVLPGGTNALVLKSGTTGLLDKNIYGSPAGHYSMLVYDSSLTATTPGIIMLTDNLTAVDSVNHANYRFIYCSPDTLAIDLYLTNSTDTIKITSQSFIGKSPNPSSYQAFTTGKRGSYKPYIFKTGTAFTSTALLSADTVVLGSKGIYSLVYSGKRGSTGADSLKLAFIQHPSN